MKIDAIFVTNLLQQWNWYLGDCGITENINSLSNKKNFSGAANFCWFNDFIYKNLPSLDTERKLNV